MRRAFVVEDDEEDQDLVRRLLFEAGFVAVVVPSAADARVSINGDSDYDLFIFDRNLPEVTLGQPSFTIGDGLLVEFRRRFPDAPFLVFTGHPEDELYQAVHSGSGQLVVTDQAGLVDEVFVLTKFQTMLFLERAKRIATLLDVLDAIDLEAEPGTTNELSWKQRRLFRKNGAMLRGTRVTYRVLADGRSGAPVWHLQTFDAGGRLISSDVAKETSHLIGTGETYLVGVQTSASASLIAAFRRQVSGLSGGLAINVFQSAGANSRSSFHLLDDNPIEASRVFGVVAGGLQESAITTPRSFRLEDITTPFVNWDEVEAASREVFQIETPDSGLQVWSRVEAQHGDLHPGNVLTAGTSVALIDFDRQCMGSRLTDPVTLLLACFLHPDSPWIEKREPPLDEMMSFFELEFLTDNPDHPLAPLLGWLVAETSSVREIWACVLGYVVRQLRWRSPATDPIAYERIVALGRRAIERLTA